MNKLDQDIIEDSIKNNLPILLEKHNLTISNKNDQSIIISALTYYIYNMITNVCALLSIVTKINNPNKNIVRTKDIKDAIQHIKTSCINKKQINNEKTGGSNHKNIYSDQYMVLYYYTPDLMYNLEKITSNNNDIELFDKVYIDKFFKAFGVNINNNNLTLVQKLMKVHLKCFLNDLHNEGKITINKIERVVEKSRNVIFT